MSMSLSCQRLLDLNLPQTPSRLSLTNITRRMYGFLKTPLKRGKMDARSVVIYGNRGSGKSIFKEAVATELVEHFGSELVNVLKSDDYWTLIRSVGKTFNPDTREMEYCDKPITILMVEDPMTYHMVSGARSKEQKATLGKFLKARHILEKKLETRTGILIEMFGPQTIHLFERMFRNADIKVIKSELGPEEQDAIFDIVDGNQSAIRFLKKLTHRTRKVDDLKKFSICSFGTYVGYVRVPLNHTSYSQWIESNVRSEEERQKEEDAILDKYATHFLKSIKFKPTSNKFKDALRVEILKVSYKPRMVLAKNMQTLHSLIKVRYRDLQGDEDDEDFFDSSEVEAIVDESFKDFAVRSCEADLSVEHAQVLERIMSGWKQIDIATELFGDVDQQPQISRLIEDITNKYLGYYFEKWYCKTHGVDHTSGATHTADFVDANGNIKSLKCKKGRAHVSIYPIPDCLPEIKLAKQMETTFTIVCCNPLVSEKIKGKLNRYFIQESPPIKPDKPPKVVRFFKRDCKPVLT